jgi:hypothetical protein
LVQLKSSIGYFSTHAWWRIVALLLLTIGMDKFHRGYGTIRAFLLVGVAALVATSLQSIPAAVRSEPHRWLMRIVALLLAAHVVYCGVRLYVGHVGPIGAVTLTAAQMLARGENPYTANIDLDPIVEVGPTFGGYKYLPVMPIVYMPLGLIFGNHGMILTNFLLDLAAALLIFLAARRDGGRTAGLIATAAYLSLPLVFGMVYAISVTDLVPVTFLLGSVLVNDRRPFTGGLLLGLSVSSKLLPGLAAAPACIPNRGRSAFCLGIATGLLPVLLAFVMAPHAFIENIVRFNMARPVWSTSWLYGQPAWVSEASRVLFGLAWLGLAVFAARYATRVTVRSGMVVLLLVAVLLAGPQMEQNYNLWWIPFLCIVLAVSTDLKRKELKMAENGDAVFRQSPALISRTTSDAPAAHSANL